MLIGSCPHCSYLNSEGEKNLEWLEICIIYSIFFWYTICLLALNIAQRIRTQSIIYYYHCPPSFLQLLVFRSYNYLHVLPKSFKKANLVGYY